MRTKGQARGIASGLPYPPRGRCRTLCGRVRSAESRKLIGDGVAVATGGGAGFAQLRASLPLRAVPAHIWPVMRRLATHWGAFWRVVRCGPTAWREIRLSLRDVFALAVTETCHLGNGIDRKDRDMAGRRLRDELSRSSECGAAAAPWAARRG
jgi:hypothetical protein